MPTKTFVADGPAGVMVIGDYGFPSAAKVNPYPYLSQLNFHSGLPYIQIRARCKASVVYVDGVTRSVITWEDGDKGCGGCFITTACVEYLGKTDNCQELETLRKFRDNVMLRDERYSALVAEYYCIAPQIVAAIALRKDARKVYQEIYDEFLVKSISAIEAGNDNEAIDIYRKMVLRAKELGGMTWVQQ